MPKDVQSEQCPFCNAKWGECSHVNLLLEWEAEALVREAQAELGCYAVKGEDLRVINPQLPSISQSAEMPGGRN